MSVFPDRIRLKNTTDSFASTVTDLTPPGLSGSFSASNSYLTLPANNVLAMGTSDFTIETWVYLGAPNNARTIIDTQPIGSSFQRNNAMLIIVEANAKINIYSASNYRGMSTSALLADQWNHIAIVRSGTTWRYFINGIKDATEYTYSVNLSLATGAIIGRSSENTGPLPFNGNLQDFRITKGVARYSTNFTLPAGPLPSGVNDPHFSSVSLLLRMVGPNNSTVFTDSSTNNLTVTPVGNAKITNLLGLFAPPDPLPIGEVAIHRGSGEARMLAQTTVKTIAQLTTRIRNGNKGSLTVSNEGYGSTSFVLNNGSVTSNEITDGAITAAKISGAIGINKGGTGQSSATSAINALLPSQTGNANKALTTDGSNPSWIDYPLLAGAVGTSGYAEAQTVSIDALPDVDTSTSPPLSNQALKWNFLTSRWAPAEDVTAPIPWGPAAPGKAGQLSRDGEYLYICVATNTWRRILYSTWTNTLAYIPATTSTATVFGLQGVGINDSFFANVSLLLHFDGSNGSTTIVDSGPLALTSSISAFDTTISTAQSKYGGASGFFQGQITGNVGGYLSIPTNNAFSFGSGDFTIEAWIYKLSGGGTEYTIVSYLDGSGTQNSFRLTVSSTQIIWRAGNTAGNFDQYALSVNSATATGIWYHVALTKASSVYRFFVNGTQAGSNQTLATTLHSPTTIPLRIGVTRNSLGNFQDWFKGYIDEFRITKGVARYTSNFTPRPSAFPDLGL